MTRVAPNHEISSSWRSSGEFSCSWRNLWTSTSLKGNLWSNNFYPFFLSCNAAVSFLWSRFWCKLRLEKIKNLCFHKNSEVEAARWFLYGVEDQSKPRHLWMTSNESEVSIRRALVIIGMTDSEASIMKYLPLDCTCSKSLSARPSERSMGTVCWQATEYMWLTTKYNNHIKRKTGCPALWYIWCI